MIGAVGAGDGGGGTARARRVGDLVKVARARRLTAELGKEATVHLRWPAGGTSPAAKVSVRELYYWDLRAPGPSCTAVPSW